MCLSPNSKTPFTFCGYAENVFRSKRIKFSITRHMSLSCLHPLQFKTVPWSFLDFHDLDPQKNYKPVIL